MSCTHFLGCMHPLEASQLKPCFADYSISVMFPVPLLSEFEALLYQADKPVGKDTRASLNKVDIASPCQFSVFRQGLVIIETENMLPTLAVQPVVNLENLSATPPILPPHWQD